MATMASRKVFTHDEYKASSYIGIIGVIAFAAFGLYLFSLIQSAENVVDLFGLTGLLASGSYLLQPAFSFAEMRLMPFVSKMPHSGKFFPIWALVITFDIFTTYWGLNHWAQSAPFIARLIGQPTGKIQEYALTTVASTPASIDPATVHIAVSVVCFVIAAAIAVGFEYLIRLCYLAVTETIKATW